MFRVFADSIYQACIVHSTKNRKTGCTLCRLPAKSRTFCMAEANSSISSAYRQLRSSTFRYRYHRGFQHAFQAAIGGSFPLICRALHPSRCTHTAVGGSVGMPKGQCSCHAPHARRLDSKAAMSSHTRPPRHGIGILGESTTSIPLSRTPTRCTRKGNNNLDCALPVHATCGRVPQERVVGFST